MNTTFSWDRFEAFPVAGILRGFTVKQLPAIVNAASNGGLTTLEITMNTPEAEEQIAWAANAQKDRMNIGAGTVTSLELLDRALAAGAAFIVTPSVDRDVIRTCRERGVPVFPGALSPDEVCRAWESGASMVKIFPAEVCGPAHIRRLKEIFPEIRLMPTGGVDLETLAEYARAGADGFGIGSPLFNKDRILAGDWGWLENRVAAFRRCFP